MSESTTYAVPPVERALKLLRHIGAGDPVINVSRIAAALGINRTTLIRLLHTLEAERFIERRPDGVGWRLASAPSPWRRRRWRSRISCASAPRCCRRW